MAYTILLNNFCNVSFDDILPSIRYFHKLSFEKLFVFFSNDFLQMSGIFNVLLPKMSRKELKIRHYLIEKIMFS